MHPRFQLAHSALNRKLSSNLCCSEYTVVQKIKTEEVEKGEKQFEAIDDMHDEKVTRPLTLKDKKERILESTCSRNKELTVQSRRTWYFVKRRNIIKKCKSMSYERRIRMTNQMSQQLRNTDHLYETILSSLSIFFPSSLK